MWNRKRWIAFILTLAIAFSDCGSISAFATEYGDTTAAMSVSENHVESPTSEETENVMQEEAPAEEEPVSDGGTASEREGISDDGTASENETSADSEAVSDKETISGNDTDLENGTGKQEDGNAELPELHIGQIKKGETIPDWEDLPDPDDPEFVYDQPISITSTDSLLLFVNYGIDGMPENVENGTLCWSILRGEKGMSAGSPSLLNEEEDWIGFEAVADCPYFTMKEKEEESGCRKTAELIPETPADGGEYDYYIRAAYYLGTEEEQRGTFYAATTVPFLPGENEMTPDDAAEAEEVLADGSQNDDSDGENMEPGEVQDDTLPGEEVGAEETEPVGDREQAEPETEEITEESGSEAEPVMEEQIGELLLNPTSLIMEPGETQQVTATTIPENIPVRITWDSSDESVAKVNENGEITAVAEGYAKITAVCCGKTAAVSVDVVQAADTNNKLLDLSGDIRVAGFRKESDEFVYTGQKITQDIRVYHKETLLKEKTDYTLSYKNNINAAGCDAINAPSVTIKLKGQYSGTVTLFYAIKPMDINNIDGYGMDQDNDSPGYEQTVPYSVNLKIPAPALTFGKKKLAANKDFVCDYTTLPAEYNKGDSYQAGEVYHYTVNGIGNYTGSFQMQLVVLEDKSRSFNSASVALEQKQYEYRGTALSKSEVTIRQVKVSGQVLDSSLYDHEVCANGIEGAYVTVYPSAAGRAAGYRGCKKVNLKMVGDRNIAEAAVGDNWKESFTFSQKEVDKNGGIFQGKTGVLTFGEGKEELTEGEDYTVKYGNARKAGRVTATFTGKGRYKGTLKLKYEIKPNKENLEIVWGKNVTKQGTMPAVAYQKGGAEPEFTIRDQDRNILKNKTDYTVKLVDNKTPGAVMSCEITGKGNYKGYTKTVQLNVTMGDISKATMSIEDRPESAKQSAWKSKIVITDGNGKKLKAGVDYDDEPVYTYRGMESGELPKAGTDVTVTVHGKGYYENSSITGSYRIYEKNIGRLKFVIDPQEYTGEEIKLSRSDIHVYASSADAKNDRNEITEEDCFEIVEAGYKNNVKAGTAKVTLRGTGNYGGTKTYSFKIQKKVYQINHVKGIKLNETSLTLALVEREERRTLTATLTADSGEAIANPTVVWATSDSSIATVEDRGVHDVTAAAVITLKKEGNVTITVTTQEGNKKAQCKVTIVDAPLLKQVGQTIEGEAGQTARLELERQEGQEVDPEKIVWESNNETVVSVTKDGLYGNLTMKKQGAAVIKVTYKGKYTQQCYVVVKGEETLPEGRALVYERSADCTDDTPYINRLLREWEENPDAYDYMYLPAGVYWIDATENGYDILGKYKFGGIVLTDNQTLIMSPSALLMTIGNNKDKYHVIYAFGRKNITISGGQIIGERREHKGSDGEAGHGIQIDGCTNVTIKDIDISQCWGDGIYLGYYGIQKKYSEHITITNCNLHHNRRSNLSITDAGNITIDRCKFNYASGTDPQYGIDIEPNESRPCEHVVISNSEFKGNAKGSMGIIKPANDIRLKNCTMDGAFYNMAGKNVVLENTKPREVVDPVNGITYK